VRATQSNCLNDINFFHLNHAPNSPIEEIKQLVEFSQCTNKAFKGDAFSRFPVLYQLVQKHELFDVAQ